MEFYKLVIKDIKRETPQAVSVAFQVPAELQHNYQYIAGQYVTIKLNLDGKEVRRAYSLCSSPKSGEWRIAIKAVNQGTFSTFANTNLAVGDVLEVSLPEGKFNFEPKLDHQRNYSGFAAGSGITPIISIAKSVLEEEPNSTFVLVYGNKSVQETIFHDELIQLQKKFLGRFFVHFVYSQETISGEFSGRIDKNTVVSILKQKHSDKEFDKFYLCGPEAMINEVSKSLKENGILEKKIKFELFGTSPSENIETNNTNGHSQITVIVDSDETTFEMSQKQTILEAAIKQGLDVPYSCQGGICSSCICRITEGSANLLKNQILSDDEIAEGLTLACQAVPTSTTITINFDEL